MRGVLSDEYRQRHANAPKLVPWHSGTLALNIPCTLVVNMSLCHSGVITLVSVF